MDEATAGQLLTRFEEVLDEMRETTNLLPAAELSRTSQRRGWRKVVYGFARSRAELSAGFAMQYLTENTGRARDHWCEALSVLGEIDAACGGDDVIARMNEDLRAAGLDQVLPRLRPDAIPYATADAAVHLSAVVATIRDCAQVAVTARNRLALQRLRDERA